MPTPSPRTICAARTGAISDDFVTNDHLLAIIVQMFHRGEVNKIKLANLAITKFEAEALV
jgi:hypothetical protein